MIIDFRVIVPPSESKAAVGAPWTGYLSNYNRLYPAAGGPEQTVASMLRNMDAAGVDLAVLQPEWAFGDYRDLNAAVARIVKAHPHRFLGYCTVNPAEDDDMVQVVERAVHDQGIRGLNLQPFAYRLMANDKRFYALYAKCQDLRIPVTIHTSINFSNDRSIEYGRPLALCEIACDFPDLTIVANHGGWPWVPELIAIAWKHPNLFIEIGAISPKYIAMPGSGWEMLLRYGNSLLQDQVLFATDCMIPFARAVEELRALPLKEEVKRKWLGDNAARLLGVAPKR